MDIASPWDHRVYENDGEKIEKYRDLKREIGRLAPVVVGALTVVSNRLDEWLEKLDQNGTITENSLVRHIKDSKKAVGKLKEKK